MTSLGLTYFAIGWIAAVYIFNSMLIRGFKRIEWKRALLYISTVALIGVFGEIFIDSLYAGLFGSPLWRYTALPIHHAYTSYYAVILWGIYGFHLYLLHDSLGKKAVTSSRHLALIFSAEALVLEALVNLSFRASFGKYVYYYLPNGLWHVSAFQNFPIYFAAGLVITKSIKRFKADPVFFTVMNGFLITVLVFLA